MSLQFGDTCVAPDAGAETVRITIITSTLNCASSLARTAASIRDQAHRELQWIVADGASSDGTIEVIRRNTDIISHWFSEADKGIYDAWNKACRLIDGQWVLFLGGGDTLVAPDSLSRAAARLPGLSGTLLAYAGVVLVDATDRPIQFEREVDLARWHQGRPCLPCHQGVFHHSSLLRKPEPFDTSFRICADAKLMLNAVEMATPVYLGFDVAKMVAGGVSTSTAGWMTMARENRRICTELGLRSPMFHRLGMMRLHAKLAVGLLFGSRVGTVANFYRRLTGRKAIY